jgi:hypothetical protein
MTTADAEFLEDVLDMGLSRVLADVERGGNLLVREAARDQ